MKRIPNPIVLALFVTATLLFFGAACAFAKDETLLLESRPTPTSVPQVDDVGVDMTIQEKDVNPEAIAVEVSSDRASKADHPEIEENPGNQSNSRVTIINDDALLQKRIRSVNEQIEIGPAESDTRSFLPRQSQIPDTEVLLGGWVDAVGGVGLAAKVVRLLGFADSDAPNKNPTPEMRVAQKNETLALTLIAEVAPPVVDGVTLQATSVDIQGNNAYVSYNVRGNPFLGGIDVIDVKDEDNPEIKSQALFKDSDVHSLTFSNGNVYAAQATNDPAFENAATLEVIDTKGGRLVLDNNERVPLRSYAATSVAVSGSKVFVTTGNTGGLFVYDRKSLELEEFIELDDARWVSVDKKKVAVMQGTPGRITVIDEKELDEIGSFRIDGADIPESKSTVQVMSDIALVAAGMEGMQIVGLDNGDVLAEIPMPIVSGLSPDVTVTNAVTGDGDLIFISNGEAGVYAAQSERKLTQYKGDSPIALDMIGTLQFDREESVNHVTYKGKYLFIASGLGGLKIVKVEKVKDSKSENDEDADDESEDGDDDDDEGEDGKGKDKAGKDD